MKSIFLSLCCCLALGAWFCLSSSEAVEEKPVVSTDTPEKITPARDAADQEARVKQAELEKKFKDDLTNVTLVGRWRLIENGKLGKEKEEKYTISGVTKLGKLWIISARIQYADKDVTIPVPLKVHWADDTPVISVTNAGLPGLGKYTARVMIHDGFYTGIWSGTNYGGLMSGKIVKNDTKNQKGEQ